MNDEAESQRFNEKRAHFLGSAKLFLELLHFEEAPEFLNQKNIKRLEKIFELEGCLRLDPEHHIPVIIDLETLTQSLDQSDVRRGELFTSTTPPELLLPRRYRVNCLHGRHRVAAARNFLFASDRWWTVDLYSQGMSSETLVVETDKSG